MPKEKLGLIYERDFFSSGGMSERDQQAWRLMAIKGDAFEIPGAYGDDVYMPKIFSDSDPAGSSEINNLRLENIQRLIEWIKKNNSGGYGVG